MVRMYTPSMAWYCEKHSRYTAPMALRLASSFTMMNCIVMLFEPEGDCMAKDTHSRINSSGTGLSKSRRLRTARVVERSSSGFKGKSATGETLAKNHV